MRFLIHIGQPKTGTTSLQRFLHRNHEALYTMGVTYCHSEGRADANMWFEPFRPRLLSSNRSDVVQHIHRARRELESRADPDHLNLVSAETISNNDPKFLRDIFDGHDVTFVAYIRNELDFLASSYAQFIHANDRFVHIDQYIEARKRRHNGQFLHTFGSAFGDQFTGRIFARDRLQDGSILVDFLAQLPGVEPTADLLERARRFRDMNPSITDEVIVFKRMMLERDPERVHRTRASYRALSRLAESFGSKFRLPASARDLLVDKLSGHCVTWSRDYFNESPVFDYSAYPFEPVPVPFPLDESRFDTMSGAYDSLYNEELTKSG